MHKAADEIPMGGLDHQDKPSLPLANQGILQRLGILAHQLLQALLDLAALLPLLLAQIGKGRAGAVPHFTMLLQAAEDLLLQLRVGAQVAHPGLQVGQMVMIVDQTTNAAGCPQSCSDLHQLFPAQDPPPFGPFQSRQQVVDPCHRKSPGLCAIEADRLFRLLKVGFAVGAALPGIQLQAGAAAQGCGRKGGQVLTKAGPLQQFQGFLPFALAGRRPWGGIGLGEDWQRVQGGDGEH